MESSKPKISKEDYSRYLHAKKVLSRESGDFALASDTNTDSFTLKAIALKSEQIIIDKLKKGEKIPDLNLVVLQAVVDNLNISDYSAEIIADFLVALSIKRPNPLNANVLKLWDLEKLRHTLEKEEEQGPINFVTASREKHKEMLRAYTKERDIIEKSLNTIPEAEKGATQKRLKEIKAAQIAFYVYWANRKHTEGWNSRFGDEAAHKKADSERDQKVRGYIRGNIDAINSPIASEKGDTLLHWAVKRSPFLINVLLDEGANESIIKKNNDGITPLELHKKSMSTQPNPNSPESKILERMYAYIRQ